MLELRDVSKRFLGTAVVDRVSFRVEAGIVTGYLGPNGSGKSTTMKMIGGLIAPGSGEILYNGERIDRDWRAFRQKLGYVPEEPHLYTHLSCLEYLTMVSQLRGLDQKKSSARIDGLLRLLGMHASRYTSISACSKGMRQKILLIAALLHDPELILFDEPFSGLDVETAQVLRALLAELATRGKTVLFSSHEFETVERCCAQVIILHKGRVVADGSADRLRALLSAPSLEAVFSQLTSERDPAQVSREIADLVQG